MGEKNRRRSAQIDDDPRIPLVSATGCDQHRDSKSTRQSSLTGVRLGGRLILELGGNNSLIIAPSADINRHAIDFPFFFAGRTAGQRCSTSIQPCGVIAHN